MDNLLLQLQEQLKLYNNDSSKEEIPILEILWDHYYQTTPIRSEQVRQVEDKLAPAFEVLSFEASNDAFALLYDLVESYQHAAFIEGIQVGLQIHGLLQEKCTP